jgi:VIT1/CCC1 family predicted Fe2+/Mn2+ transporter
MSMAAGEYVSVSSQADTEHADLARETKELATDPEGETEELTQIYAARGVEAGLARQVAIQLMAKDALAAHSHDELGISEATTARPVQAAMASAATFTVGAAAPLILTLISPPNLLLPSVAADSTPWRDCAAPGLTLRLSGGAARQEERSSQPAGKGRPRGEFGDPSLR